MKPAAKRVAADYLQSDYEVGVTRACGLIGISRSSYRYQSCRGDDAPLRTAIRQKAQERKRWGYRRLQVLLQRDGLMDNHKRIYRIYREEGLQVRKRRRKRARTKRSFELLPSSGTNQRWSMDFMHDSTASGRKLRILNVVDDTPGRPSGWRLPPRLVANTSRAYWSASSNCGANPSACSQTTAPYRGE